jgi:hypothetical protein
MHRTDYVMFGKYFGRFIKKLFGMPDIILLDPQYSPTILVIWINHINKIINSTLGKLYSPRLLIIELEMMQDEMTSEVPPKVLE